MAGEHLGAAPGAVLTDPLRVAAAARLLQDPDGLHPLDRLTALTRRLIGCRYVHVAVLAEELVVASRAGRPIGEGEDGQLHGTLCGLTVTESAPVRLDDAAVDPRVRDFAVVRSGDVRAYLGIPLVTPGGAVIGALCCVDPFPHRWHTEQVDVLDDLATAVTAELELAAVSAELAEAADRQELVLEAGELGTFDMDLVTGRIRWDERMSAMFGYPPGGFTGDLTDISARVHPDDRQRVLDTLRAAIRECGSYEADYRIALPGQPVRWQRNRGRAIAGPDGVAVRVTGAAYDSTRVRDADAHVARLLETLPSGFCSINRHHEITYLNTTAARLIRVPRQELAGRNVFEALPWFDEQHFEHRYGAGLRSGQAVRVEEYVAPLETWFDVRVWPFADGFSIHFDDITDRHRIGEERRAALAAREQALLAAERATAHLTLLADTSARMGATLEAEEVVDVLLDAVVPRLGRWARVRLTPEHDEGPTALSRTTFERGDHDEAPDPTGRVTLPLTSRGEAPLGSLTVQLLDPDPVARLDEEELLGNLADRASAALDNARLYATQQRMSEALQRSMLTRLPEVDDLAIAARYRPTADHAQVGGDWYDAFVLADGRTMLVIGDVIGHDRHAAAAMGQLRNLLRGLSFGHGSSPAELLQCVDRAIPALQVDCLATAVVACVEPAGSDPAGVRRVRWANAGHVPPVVVRRDGGVELLERVSSLLLGVDAATERTEHTVLLGPQDTLMLYTDGLVERRDRALTKALEDLVGFLAASPVSGQSLDDLCDVLVHEMVPERPEDDVALIVVQPR